ncbi:Type I restriction-modification system, specificity subunit S [Bacteroides ovatus]|uniref:restriction endonuclease subunit S n=1 Tax=Bacteroides ovatus TaxID=28116 RepID=UPI0020A804EA|nr:restriction endonuclease subunit S [Bacteroides ovatus]CAG9903477.1 Type I restriction-modification system, specificity subunit S [Bacteroides ovatus]
MEEWKNIKACDYCYNVTDGTHDSPKQKESGKYLITSRHIKNNRIDFESAYKISEDDYNKIISRSKVNQWDIIISMIGAYCGYCCIESSKQTDYAIKNVGLLKVGNELRCKWLYYYLTSPYGKQQLSMLRSGSSQPYISLGALRNLEIPIPNREVMSSIVSILSALDAKIELNRRINDNLEQQAQALFKSWFVDFEPFKDGKFVESELGMIPKGCRVGKAEDFYNINIGKTPPRKEQVWFSSNSSDYIWVSISDLGSCGRFVFTSSEFLTHEAIKRHNIILVPKDTILLSFKLTIGRVGIAGTELTTNEAIARFITSDENREYTYFLLKGYNYEKLGSTSSIATAVNSKIIKAMVVLMPDKEILKAFSSLTKPYFDQILRNEQESIRLTILRDTLLPKLMSGELKINATEVL